MLAYGKLSKDMMNNGYVGCKLGFEFSGLLSGKRVMGVAKQAVATHVFARNYLVSIPFRPTHTCILKSPPPYRVWFLLQGSGCIAEHC